MAVVANLVVRVTAAMSDLEKDLKGIEGKFNRVGGRLQAVGSNLTKGLTLPIAAVGGLAVKAAVDFESSFTGIRKTVDATETQFAALAQGMRDMAKTKPIDVNELNRIGELGGQLGVSTDALLDFTSVTADLANTTNLSAEAAAEGLARLSNIMQTPADQFSNLGSTIVDLGNKFAASESEILEFGLRIAGAGKLAGLSEANVFGIGTAMASVGVEAEAGGTAVQKVLLTMTEAVSTGNDSLQVFAKTAGVSASAFQDLFRANPAEAFTLFVEGLGQSGQGAFQILSELDLQDQRLTRSFLSLAGAGDLLRRTIDTGTTAFQQNTALTKEAATRYATVASQWQLLKNKFYDAGITSGNVLLPAIERLRPSIESLLAGAVRLIDGFSRLPQPVQTVSFALLGIAAAAGPITYLAGSVAKVVAAFSGLMRLTGVAGIIGKISGAIGEIVLATQTFGFEGLTVWLADWGLLGEIIMGVGRAFTVLTGPVGIVIGLVSALLYGVKELTGSWTAAFTIILPPVGLLMSAWQQLTSEVGASGTVFGTIWQILKDIGSIIANTVAPILRTLWNVLVGVGSAVRDALGGAVSWVANKLAILKGPIQWLQEKIQWILDKIPKIPSLGQIENFTGAAAGRTNEPNRPKSPDKGLVSTTRNVDAALAMLETQLDADVAAFNRLGEAGTRNLKNTTAAAKELLDATRVISGAGFANQQVTLAAGFTGPGGVGAGMESGLGGLMDQFKNTLPSTDKLRAAANRVMLGGAVAAIEGTGKAIHNELAAHADENAKLLADSVDSAFRYFAGSLSPALAGLLGGVLNMFKKAIGDGGFLHGVAGKFGKQIGGAIDAGLAGFGSGFGLGAEFGTGAGMLGGAASGAAAGAAFGPFGAAIGGIAGFFGGLFGGKKKKREEQQQMAQMKADLLEQFDGMENLRAVAERAGVSVDLLFSTDKAKVFKAEMESVTSALKAYQERIAGVITDIDTVMSKGGIIGADLWQRILSDADADEIKAKLAEVFSASVEQSATGFNQIAQNFELIKAPLSQIGVLADAAFAGLIAGGASIPEAIMQIGDGLAHIQEIMAKSGQTATGPLADLLNYQKIIQANEGLFTLLSGVDAMLTGLANSGLLTQQRFTALGATIVQSFTALQQQGVAGATALELMQPQLQKLWEAQQQFGLQTDAATQSLLNQAIQQGIVGEQMKSVDQQILDVLKAIATVLGAELPAAVQTFADSASSALEGVSFQATATGEAIKGAGGELIQIPTQFQALFDAIDARGPQTFEQLQAVLSALPPEMQALAAQFDAWLQSMFGGTTDRMGAFGGTMAATFGASVDGMVASVTPKFKAIADAANGALDQIPNQIPMELRMKLRNETGIKLDGINQAISAGIRIQPFAEGGIVTGPTLGLLGEDGPEAVVPLDDYEGAGGVINITVNGTADRDFAKVLAREINRGGDVRTAWEVALR